MRTILFVLVFCCGCSATSPVKVRDGNVAMTTERSVEDEKTKVGVTVSFKF